MGLHHRYECPWRLRHRGARAVTDRGARYTSRKEAPFDNGRQTLDMGVSSARPTSRALKHTPECSPKACISGAMVASGPLPATTRTLVLSMVQRGQVAPRQPMAALRKTFASRERLDMLRLDGLLAGHGGDFGQAPGGRTRGRAHATIEVTVVGIDPQTGDALLHTPQNLWRVACAVGDPGAAMTGSASSRSCSTFRGKRCLSHSPRGAVAQRLDRFEPRQSHEGQQQQ